MLKLLKHPNIVELLGFYTYRDIHNFLFPLARGGTLADLLAGKRPAQFQSDESLIVALVGLSSALCAVHEFDADDLKAIGCHHDLKPSNILIDGSKFILADFGISRFKETTQPSHTPFKGGRGDFIAPEWEDLEGESGPKITQR
jgi:serine/threonine protein kinase